MLNTEGPGTAQSVAVASEKTMDATYSKWVPRTEEGKSVKLWNSLGFVQRMLNTIRNIMTKNNLRT